MSTSSHQPGSSPSLSLISSAWIVTLLVSSLFDILWFELTGTQPLWILVAKVVLLVALILISRYGIKSSLCVPISLCFWQSHY